MTCHSTTLSLPKRYVAQKNSDSSNPYERRGEAQIKQQSLDGSEEGKNEKPDGIYDDQRAEPSVTDQHEEFSGNTESEFASKLTGKLGKDRVDYYKLVAAGTAAKMRKSGNIVYMVMAITLAFAFGMYVNNLIRSYKKPEN
ncbi:heat shock family protein [Dorcoceras hygrometricum]|uniref:Heat shock family protein n=1 Tax=Dorcoceras hygrometricum TaxID=472368 RepID=A0A2Z7D5V4_9LAMI|nr:heat shock family protein [Dorcoceras hygrometricum]